MLLQSDVGARDKIEGPALEALKEFLDMLYEVSFKPKTVFIIIIRNVFHRINFQYI